MILSVGARRSPLSRAQVDEIKREFPQVDFDMVWVETIGDRDQKTSLRSMGKTDFFTRELDELVLKKLIRIAIHSAKDLPDPLPEGLAIAALTRGVDPRDSLVWREKELPIGALIATSSDRREAMVRAWRSDVRFCDVRGTIEARLSKLFAGDVDGVVIAEAALIRLKLTHLCRKIFDSPTVDGQGQLAIICQSADREMIELFSRVDARCPAFSI